ncbi:hypothetical protein BKH43_01555 [Helicobacter sp. 13S00401-1]|uniref:MFS transporter n=1 Tax=Helicobacter sp. 13S00401-1 TaxID=1905758 RepID=UPI000BA68B9E|nr:MFS transporter [Helicobacter sp. 13S00401-1]PAF51352.1 hypothetical protein BKH43_01555 [Helicobacter sp. 13S00401-1]
MFVKILPMLLTLMFRFFGLFIILPVISVTIDSIANATYMSVGIALGVPYLVQIFTQPIFGRISDKFDRRHVVIVGIIIFVIGNIVCALSPNIEILILGRVIEGIGAIGGVLSAMVADSVKEEFRIRAMAIMGIGIFVSFVVAIIVGLVVGTHFGLRSLFWISAILNLISILFVLKAKKIEKIRYDYHRKDRATSKSIYLLSGSVLLEKFFMTATFMIAPLLLSETFGVSKTNLYMVYIPGLVLGILAMGVGSMLSEKRNKNYLVLVLSVFMFVVAYVFMYYSISFVIFGIGLIFFFMGFVVQEALLQGLVSKLCLASQRGRVLGDFNAFGFAGSFLGAFLGGFAHAGAITSSSYNTIFIIAIIVAAIWFILVALIFKNPKKNATFYVESSKVDDADLKQLDSLKSIVEYYKNETQGVVTIKYRANELDPKELNAMLHLKA